MLRLKFSKDFHGYFSRPKVGLSTDWLIDWLIWLIDNLFNSTQISYSKHIKKKINLYNDAR